MSDVELTEWAVLPGIDDPWLAPEAAGARLGGFAKGHPTQPDGKRIRTSRIEAVDGRRIKTFSRWYLLVGPPHPDYVEWMTEHGYEYDEANPVKFRTRAA